MQIEAGKVRKGMLILIEGESGPRRVTKREKWNSSYCRIYYTEATTTIPRCTSGRTSYFQGIASYVYERLDKLFTVYQPEGQESK